MINFCVLPLSNDTLAELTNLKIDYVFQPIFYPDGKTVYAREALMRPYGKSVTDLIDEYVDMGKLHILEVATLFGATMEFILRGYSETLSINTFPNEHLTEYEAQVFKDYFGDDTENYIFELLEYPEFSSIIAKIKRMVANKLNHLIAIDDFGSGANDYDVLDSTKPNIIKIARSLIADIDKDEYKKSSCQELIDTFHSKNIKVVAEGIETKAEFDVMKELGSDYFQGFYLGPPQ